MKEQKHLLSYVRRAIDDYNMIEEGDRIAVGVSGGKDSLTLLAALAGLRRFYPKKFELIAISEDMGFEGSDWSAVSAFCEKLDVEYHIEKTDIAKIVFDIRKEARKAPPPHPLMPHQMQPCQYPLISHCQT